MGYPKPPRLEKDNVSSRQNHVTRQRLDRGDDECGPSPSKALIKLSGRDYGERKHGVDRDGGNSHAVSRHDRREHSETSGHREKSSRGTHNYSDDYEDNDCGPSFSEKTSRLDRNNYGKSKHGGSKHGGNKHSKTSHGLSEHDKGKQNETSGHRGKSSRGAQDYSDDYEDEGFSSETDGLSDDFESDDDDFPYLSDLRGHLPKVNHDVARSRPSVRATAPPSSPFSSLGSFSPNAGNYISRGHRNGSHFGSGHGSSTSTAISRGPITGPRGFRPKRHHGSSSHHEHDPRVTSGGNLGFISSLQSRRSAQYQSNSAPPYVYSNAPTTSVGVYAHGGVLAQPAGASYGHNHSSVYPTATAVGSVRVIAAQSYAIGAQSYVQGQVGGQYWSNPVHRPGYWNHSPTSSVAPMGLTRMTAGKQGKCCPRCGCSGHHNH